MVVPGAVLAGCSSDDPAGSGVDSESPTTSTSVTQANEADAATGEMFPDIIEVEVSELGDGEYSVSATVSSPYDSPDRYADAWRVLDPSGSELGVRELTHDHATEQPFTRSLTLEIPDDVGEVTVEGRDQLSGYGGATVTIEVPRGD